MIEKFTIVEITFKDLTALLFLLLTKKNLSFQVFQIMLKLHFIEFS